MQLHYDDAHAFVNKTRGAFWDGWDIVLWKPNSNGMTSKTGMFRNGKWGTARRYPVLNDGSWAVPGVRH